MNDGDLQALLIAGPPSPEGERRVELPALRTLPPRERPRYGCGADVYIKVASKQWERQRSGEQSFAVFDLKCGDPRENALFTIWQQGATGQRIGIVNANSGAIFVRLIACAQPFSFGGGQCFGVSWDPEQERGSRAPAGDTIKVREAEQFRRACERRELDLLREIAAGILRAYRAGEQGGRWFELGAHLERGLREIFEPAPGRRAAE